MEKLLSTFDAELTRVNLGRSVLDLPEKVTKNIPQLEADCSLFPALVSNHVFFKSFQRLSLKQKICATKLVVSRQRDSGWIVDSGMPGGAIFRDSPMLAKRVANAYKTTIMHRLDKLERMTDGDSLDAEVSLVSEAIYIYIYIS